MRAVLFIIMAFWFLPVSSQTLKIMGSDESFLPFYYGNDLSEGILVEVINEFSLEAGITAGFRPMPRKRDGARCATPPLAIWRNSTIRTWRRFAPPSTATPTT